MYNIPLLKLSACWWERAKLQKATSSGIKSEEKIILLRILLLIHVQSCSGSQWWYRRGTRPAAGIQPWTARTFLSAPLYWGNGNVCVHRENGILVQQSSPSILLQSSSLLTKEITVSVSLKSCYTPTVCVLWHPGAKSTRGMSESGSGNGPRTKHLLL